MLQRPHKHTHTYPQTHTFFVNGWHYCYVASFSAVFCRCWFSHVLKDLPINKQQRKVSKLMGTVAIIICSHTASQIGYVAQWGQRPQKYIMWWRKMHNWEQTNYLFMFKLLTHTKWIVLKAYLKKYRMIFPFYFLFLEQVCSHESVCF